MADLDPRYERSEQISTPKKSPFSAKIFGKGSIAGCFLASGAVASAPANVPGVISGRFEVRAGEVNVPVIAYKANGIRVASGITFEEVHWIDPQITVRFEVPDWILKGRKEAQMESLISDIVFRKCTVAGKPVAAGAGIGLRPNDGVVSSGVIFEP